MTKTQTAASRGVFSRATIAIYIFLIGALGTCLLPMVRVTIPPMGKVSWSVSDIVRPVMSQVSSGQAQSSKPQVDFMDIVKEVTPKDPKWHNISLRFVLGVLVPASLVLSYVLIGLCFFLTPLRKGSSVQAASFFSLLASIYALMGTIYLTKAAHDTFMKSLGQASQGFFGIITKNFAASISISPDLGLYTLPFFCFMVFGIAIYRKGRS